MADYYVAAAGSDSNPGTLAAPWKTVTRVNAATVGLNDRVFFNRGDTFYGLLRPPTGLDSNATGWLRFGAYGSGDLPVITGYKVLNTSAGWVQHDADTWKVDYSAGNSGVTYAGYDSAQGDGDVGILKVNGAIKAVKRSSLAGLTDQWDFYSASNVLYVRSTANPTTLAADIRCTVKGDGVSLRRATEIADLMIKGHGASGVYMLGPAIRCRILRCVIGEIGGSYQTGTTRFGNGVNAWTGSTNIYAEYNRVFDVYDTAWSIQGGDAGTSSAFTNITWRRNLTYRCTQAEEYWYQGTGPGFVNCVSEYNTNLFSGYGFGADTRPDTDVRAAVLTYQWGDGNTVNAGLTLRRNIYFDARGSFRYHSHTPVGLTSTRNVVLLRPGTKMQFQTSETIADAASWAVGRETETLFGTLASSSNVVITDADVDSGVASLDVLAPTGQKVSGKVLPIHGPWRN